MRTKNEIKSRGTEVQCQNIWGTLLHIDVQEREKRGRRLETASAVSTDIWWLHAQPLEEDHAAAHRSGLRDTNSGHRRRPHAPPEQGVRRESAWRVRHTP